MMRYLNGCLISE